MSSKAPARKSRAKKRKAPIQDKTWELTIREVRVWKTVLPGRTANSAVAKLVEDSSQPVFPYQQAKIEIEDIREV